MAIETYNDDARFDRLVDGELTQPERRTLLESLDRRPDGWRRCALAFLEAQSWRLELGALARRSQQVAEIPAAVREPNMPAPTGRKPHESHRTNIGQWLAIAAGLLVAFTLGWLGRERGPKSRSPISNSNFAQVMPTPSGPNALTLFVRDSSGHNTPVRVPLVDADTLDRQFGIKFQPGIPDDIRSQLQNQGFTVQSKRQYAPLWLENGKPMVVPVEDTKIVPVNNKVF